MLVWGCILITILGGAFLSYVLLKRGIDADGSVSADRAKTLKWAGATSSIITAIFMLIVLFLRKRIQYINYHAACMHVSYTYTYSLVCH